MAIRLYAMKIPACFGYASKNNKTRKNIHFICARDAGEAQKRVIHYIFYICVIAAVWMVTCDSAIRVLLLQASGALSLLLLLLFCAKCTYLYNEWLSGEDIDTVSHSHHIAFFIFV